MEQNVNLYFESGAAVILNIEIWKRFINERGEFFRSDNPDLIQAVEIVRGSIKDNGVSFTFLSELEKSMAKATSEEKETKNTDKMAEEQVENTPKTEKRKF